MWFVWVNNNFKAQSFLFDWIEYSRLFTRKIMRNVNATFIIKSAKLKNVLDNVMVEMMMMKIRFIISYDLIEFNCNLFESEVSTSYRGSKYDEICVAYIFSSINGSKSLRFYFKSTFLGLFCLCSQCYAKLCLCYFI